MQTLPLWYRVYSKQLSFKEFLDKFNDKQYQEHDVLPIFILSVLYEHAPYINGVHVLSNLMSEEGINQRAFKYFYLYWLIGKGFANDLILANNEHGGTFSKITARFPCRFSSKNLYDWIGIILKSFFNIPIFIPEEIPYERLNTRTLTIALRYLENAQNNRFQIHEKITENIYNLAIAHNSLYELIQLFKSGPYPSILQPYRKDLVFFRNVTSCFCPSMTKSMAEFTERELEIIEEEHLRLYNHSEINFFVYYIESFAKVFDKENPSAVKLQKYLEPSNENDRIKAEQFLRSQNPIQRREYVPQYFPMNDTQLDKFIDDIKREGVVNALRPYILNSKRRILKELKSSKYELASNTIVSTQSSIFLYPMERLIFHTEEDKVYVFLPEELFKFEQKRNPYNRKQLPDYLFVTSSEDYRTETLEEIWSNILRHNIDLQQVFD